MRSFFDDMLPQTSFWEKQPMNIDEKNLEYQSLLFEKSKKTGFWVSRNYIIYESKLVKLKVNMNKKSNHFVNLNKALVVKIKYENKQEKDNCNKKKYGIRITRNQQYRELYSRTKEQNKLLLEVLKKHAILLNFRENYTIDRIIGKGNFAKVYLCVSKSTDQQYAVKAFEKCKLPNNGDLDKQALQKEIQIMRQINYKGLIKMHEVFEDEQCIYIVQDYLQGGELYHQIKKNQKLEEKVVAGIIATLLDSLDYLHKKNILHRDLKPENMILRTKGSLHDVVIADFGLADFYDPFGNYMFQRCGTPGFVAPEVLQDRIYDSKVDVFSVGCLMYLLLAGKSPFKGNTYDEVVMRNYHCKIDYPFIEKTISIHGMTLLKRLLHVKPSSRPSPREALKFDWFQINLDKQKYQELNEEQQDTRESAKSSAGSCGFMKNFIGPIVASKPEFSTPQSQPLSKKSQECPRTPQIVLMQQIQEQMDDCEEQNKFDDDLSDLMVDEESPQSHKMPQYQLVGKLKQVVDSRNSSYYASPNIKMTPQSQHKELPQTLMKEKPLEIQPTKIANKIMNSLKNLEQI